MNDLKESLFHSPTGKSWENIGVQTHHGIHIPLSSLHSEQSCGIGEFFDLIPLIQWCCRLKIDLIQLLPLNNSERDPSPYHSFSSCALSPIYLSLHALPYLEDNPQLKKTLKELSALNTPNRVPYLEVFSHKIHWLHLYFDDVGKKITESKEFKLFIKQNSWVEHYALYQTLSNRFMGTSSESWPLEVRRLPKDPKALLKKYEIEASFYSVLQYLCFIQLKKVKEHANKRGIFLMGDLPFLVGKESVDVWEYPDYFIHNLQAGAPPDSYNKEGQNWGLPIIAWEEMRKNHFSWWKRRLGYAENFFDLFRLDHVLGFFRIWAIPFEHSSTEGHFIPLDENEWGPQGKEILKMIASSTRMLPIAEDLGVVHKMVRPCLKEIGICGTKLMRWERKWEEDKSFIPPQHYDPISLTCVSTHDSETLTLWWRDVSDEAKAFAEYKHWVYTPNLTRAQREEILWDSHHTSSLLHINLLQEYLALFPELIWPNPEDERINIPGKVLSTNWTYRFRPTVEEITSHKDLFLNIKKIIFSPSPLCSKLK